MTEIKKAGQLSLNDSIFAVKVNQIFVKPIERIWKKGDSIITIECQNSLPLEFNRTDCFVHQKGGLRNFSDFVEAQKYQLELRKERIQELRKAYLKAGEDFHEAIELYVDQPASNPYE